MAILLCFFLYFFDYDGGTQTDQPHNCSLCNFQFYTRLDCTSWQLLGSISGIAFVYKSPRLDIWTAVSGLKAAAIYFWISSPAAVYRLTYHTTASTASFIVGNPGLDGNFYWVDCSGTDK